MRDPYEVLGVQRSAKPAAIKSAYRRLAKKLHPDANPNDPKAAERFAELNSAYEIVGDDAKRKAFDAGEIDAEGKPVHPSFEGFGAQPGGGFGREGSYRVPSLGRPAALNAAAAVRVGMLGSRMSSRKCLGGPELRERRDLGRGDAQVSNSSLRISLPRPAVATWRLR